MAEEKKTPDGRKLRPLADTDPRRDRLERVAGLLKAEVMPGKLKPTDEKGVLDASFEALAVEYGASLYPCFLCGQDTIEFAVWRVLCDVDDTCNLEFIRCRKCDPDGSVTRDAYLTHIELTHPELFVPCEGCGTVCLRPKMRTMGCNVCGVEVVRCREKCDTVKAYEEHMLTHANGEQTP